MPDSDHPDLVRDLSDAQLRRLAETATGELLDDVRIEQLVRRTPDGAERRRPASARRWTAAEDQLMAAAWGRGETAAQIAAQLGFTPSQVAARVEVLRGRGIELAGRRGRVTAAGREHIARRRAQGATRQAIATEIGVSITTVRNALQAMKADPRE